MKMQLGMTHKPSKKKLRRKKSTAASYGVDGRKNNKNETKEKGRSPEKK